VADVAEATPGRWLAGRLGCVRAVAFRVGLVVARTRGVRHRVGLSVKHGAEV